MAAMELAPHHPLRAARFVCLVCYKTAAGKEGTCPRCDVPLLGIGEPAVREDLLKHAERVLEQRMHREIALVVLGGIGTFLLLGPWLGYWLSLVLGLGGAVTAHTGYQVFGRGSYTATRFTRRRRLSRELGMNIDAVSDDGKPPQRPRFRDHFPIISGLSELLLVPIIWPLTYLSHVSVYQVDKLIRERTTVYKRIDRRIEERAAADPMTLSMPALLAWLGTRMVD